jgi:hypothetical protein
MRAEEQQPQRLRRCPFKGAGYFRTVIPQVCFALLATTPAPAALPLQRGGILEQPQLALLAAPSKGQVI